MSSETGWHVIGDDAGTNIAVFDVRQVPLNDPSYHKSLHIYFAPGLNPDDGQDAEEIDKLIDTIVEALTLAFGHMLENAKDTKDRLVKIYCEHPYKLSIFREFVSYLTRNHPSLYKGKFYGKWVEIQHV